MSFQNVSPNSLATTISSPAEYGPNEQAELRKRTVKLPAHARKKFKKLEDAAIEDRARTIAQGERKQALAEKRGDLQRQIASSERDKTRSSAWSEDNEAELKALREELGEVTAELQKLTPAEKFQKLPADERARRRIVGTLAAEPTGWLLAQSPLATFVEKRAELPSGKLEKALAKCREDQAAIVDELLALEAAPLNVEAALAAMRKDVARLASKGAPDVLPITSYKVRSVDGRKSQGKIGWPSGHFFDRHLTDSMTGELGVSFACWLFREQVEARLESEIRAKLEVSEDGLSVEDRQAREAALRASYLELQRLEVRICDELGVAHGPVHPLAFFEIERGPDAPHKQSQFPGGMELPRGSSPTLGVKHSGIMPAKKGGED